VYIQGLLINSTMPQGWSRVRGWLGLSKWCFCQQFPTFKCY